MKKYFLSSFAILTLVATGHAYADNIVSAQAAIYRASSASDFMGEASKNTPKSRLFLVGGKYSLQDGDFVTTSKSDCEANCEGQCMETCQKFLCTGIPK